jgi:hypothetical protein
MMRHFAPKSSRKLARTLSRKEKLQQATSTKLLTKQNAAAAFELMIEGSYDEEPKKERGEKYWATYGMARRIKKTSNGETHLAEPGEMPQTGETDEVFSLWSTAAFGKDGGDLKDFGIGIGLYFQTLLLLGTVTFCCFVIILPSLIDFRSDGYLEYSAGQKGWDITGTEIGFLQKGSMACTGNMTLFMSRTYGEAPLEKPTTAKWANHGWNTIEDTLGVYVKNTCMIDPKNGYLNLGAAGLFTVVILLFGLFVDMSEEAMDEAVQTAQDYSIVIHDPPPDATNCDEWKDFFMQFGAVAAVTVAIDNSKLLKALGKERSLRRGARRDQVDLKSHDAETKSDQLDQDEVVKAPETPAEAKSGGCLSVLAGTGDRAYYLAQLKKNKLEVGAAIVEGVQYKAQRVFVTFDTEEAQRKCLAKCQVGTIPAIFNCTSCFSSPPIFRQGEDGKGQILSISEAVEPSEVIWENLGSTHALRLATVCVTGITTIGLVALCSFLINELWAATESPALVALGISACNSVLPEIMKVLNTFEVHIDYGDGMQSLLLKLLCARLYTSAFILQIFLIPFDRTLANDTMAKIVSLLLSEAVFNPIIQWSDASTRCKQWILGPLSKSQAKLNTFYEGTVWYLSERYTNMIKTIFMTFFWCSLVPQAMLLCSMALFVNYWVDKYLLLRRWQRVPLIDASLAKDSKFYLLVCVLLHFIMTTRFYSGFSFDQVCAIDVECVQATGSNHDVGGCYLRDSDSLYGAYRNSDLNQNWGANASWVAMPSRSSLLTRDSDAYKALEVEALNIEAATNHSSRNFMYAGKEAAWVWCDRDQEEWSQYIWPETKGWMSDGQLDLVRIYRTINVAVATTIFVWFFGIRLMIFLKGLIVGNYSPVGEPKDARYHTVDDITAYIPTYTQAGILNPFIACDMTAGGVDGKYLAFESTDYDAHCALLPHEGSKNTWHFKDLWKTNELREKEGWPLFSPIKMYFDECKASPKAEPEPVDLDHLEVMLDGCRMEASEGFIV